jgi:hypothetical protein
VFIFLFYLVVPCSSVKFYAKENPQHLEILRVPISLSVPDQRNNVMIHLPDTLSNTNYFTAAERVRSSLLGNLTESAATPNPQPYKRHLYDLQQTLSCNLPDSRVSSCQKFPVFGKSPDGTFSESSTVSVGKSESGCCKFGGLNYCGSIWLCPVCAPMVAPSRVAEIKHAMGENAKSGGQSAFITFTQPHYLTNSLLELIKIQATALSKMKSTRQYKELVAKYGFIGEIRAFEITYGSNGWHPHIHAVYLFDNITINKNIKEFTSKLSGLWATWVLKSGGRLPSDAHGVDVRLPKRGDTEEIASYMGKWGEELTMSHTKETKNGSYTPFQLIEKLMSNYDYKILSLIKEYAEATKGRARLFWSRGLKDHFDILEFSDEAVASLPAKTHLFDISWNDYKIVRKVRLAGDVLDLSERYPISVVQDFISSICSMYKNFVDRENLEYSESVKRIREISRNHISQELILLGHC